MKKINKKLLGGILGAAAAFIMSTSVFAAVSIKVTGDTPHAPGKHTEYMTWLETSVEYSDGLTAKQVLLDALDAEDYVYTYNSYLESITSPKGVTLPGRSNTGYGGWLYSVNGVIPYDGLDTYQLADNDSLELFYRDDYREVYGYNVHLTANEADAVLSIFDSSGTQMTDSGWGYSLPNGSYTYTVSKDGFKTANGSFTIANDDAYITADLVKDGCALVKITGDSAHGTKEHTAYEAWASVQTPLSESTKADTLILAALDANGFAYNYSYGYLSSVTSPDGITLAGGTNGTNSGWMFRINDVIPNVGMSDATVNAGDSVELFYLDDYRILYGFDVDVYSNTENYTLHIYDNSGVEMINSGWGYSLSDGSYTYAADSNGCYPLNGSFDINGGTGSITLDFIPTGSALIKITGDTAHGSADHNDYYAWASSLAAVSSGAKADTLILDALTANGLTYDYSNGYLSSVTSSDGITLAGGTNGSYSGWMFRINDVIPNVGMSDATVNAGDTVELFYLDDYRALYGYGVNVTSNVDSPVLHIYNENGDEMFDYGWGYSLMPGYYTYAAEKGGYGWQRGGFEVVDDAVTLEINLERSFLWGDYDLDGDLNASDAANILQKVLVSTFPAYLDDITYIDVDCDGELSANDSSEVLLKVLKSTFEMPCEVTEK